MSRAFASDTSVPVDRTRAEILKLLREWNCDGIGWDEDLKHGRVTCTFRWEKDAKHYNVKFSLGLPEKIPATGRRGWGKSGDWDPVKARYTGMRTPKEEEKAQLWRSAHRLLLLKLKADLNAAVAGLARAEEIFLPWIADRNGVTVAEHVLPRLADYAAQLPPGPKP